MYVLDRHECSLVSGGSEVPVLGGGGGTGDTGGKTKNNNGYGNGAESGPAPGNSGSHNPQLWTQNSGPRGVR